MCSWAEQGRLVLAQQVVLAALSHVLSKEQLFHFEKQGTFNPPDLSDGWFPFRTDLVNQVK